MKDELSKQNIKHSINKDIIIDKKSKITNSPQKPTNIHCEDIVFEKEYINSEINKYLNIINSTNKNPFPVSKNDLPKKSIFSPQKINKISLSIDNNNKKTKSQNFLTQECDLEKKQKQKEKSLLVKNILESICHKPPENKEIISSNLDLKLYRNICPGPGDYSPQYDNLNFNLRYKNIYDCHSKKNISLIAKKFEEKYYEENVGPGSYNIINNFNNPKSFISSLGRGEFVNVENPKIGPGSYDVGKSFNKMCVGNHIYSFSPLVEKKSKLEFIEKNILNKDNNNEIYNIEKKKIYYDFKKYNKHKKNFSWKKIGYFENNDSESTNNIMIDSENKDNKDNNNHRYDYIHEYENRKEKSKKKKLFYKNKNYAESLPNKNRINSGKKNSNSNSMDKKTRLIKKKLNELGLIG